MIVKTLVNNILLDKEYIYTYNLLETNLNLEKENCTKTVQAYGIEIICETKEKGITYSVNKDQELYISPKMERIELLMDKFYNNNLSPIHLIEVLDEVIEEYIFEFDLIS